MLERYYHELQHFLTGKLKDRDEAADLTQDCFVRALAVLQAGGHIADPRAFLYRIAHNLVIDRHRRGLVRDALVSPTPADLPDTGPAAPPACEPETVTSAMQAVAALAATIESLPPRCREAFVLCKFDGFSQAEAAARMGISARTVEMQLRIALTACRACLARLEGPLPGRRPVAGAEANDPCPSPRPEHGALAARRRA